MTDHYTTLGLTADATPEQIKEAYRRLAMKYHPDRSNGDAAKAEWMGAKFKYIKEVYECLSDPERRAHYDQTGADIKAGPSIESEALQEVVKLFTLAIEVGAEEPLDFVRSKISEFDYSLESQKNAIMAEKPRLQKMLSKIKVKKVGTENLMERIIADKIAHNEKQMEHVARAEKVRDSVKAIVDEYEWTGEVRATIVPTTTFTIGTGTAFYR